MALYFQEMHMLYIIIQCTIISDIRNVLGENHEYDISSIS